MGYSCRNPHIYLPIAGPALLVPPTSGATPMTVRNSDSRLAPMVVLKAAAAAAVAGLVVYERGLIASSFEAATHVRWAWLFLAVALEGLSIASFAAIQARLLRAGSRRVGFMAVMKTVYAGGALSATVPVSVRK